MLTALREKRFQKKKVAFPFSLLLPLVGLSCVDIVVRVFPVTSTSLSVVSWELFWILYAAVGSVWALSSSLFRRDFVNEGIGSGVSVSEVINFDLETVIIMAFYMLACGCVNGLWSYRRFPVAWLSRFL